MKRIIQFGEEAVGGRVETVYEDERLAIRQVVKRGQPKTLEVVLQIRGRELIEVLWHQDADEHAKVASLIESCAEQYSDDLLDEITEMAFSKLSWGVVCDILDGAYENGLSEGWDDHRLQLRKLADHSRNDYLRDIGSLEPASSEGGR